MRDTCPACGLSYRFRRIHDRCFDVERERQRRAEALAGAYRALVDARKAEGKEPRHDR